MLHPGRLRRSGKSKVEALSNPSGSPPITGVNGSPVAERKIPPNCQPFAAHFARLAEERAWGSSQMPFHARFCRTSKSESPRANAGSKINEPSMELVKLVTAIEEELSSMLLEKA